MEQVKLIKFAGLTLRKEDKSGLQWSIRQGFPRITVYTDSNILDENKNVDYSKVIIAPFDYVTMMMFLEYFEQIIKSDGDLKYTINCYNTVYKDNKKTDEVGLQASVVVGKDKEGVVYLAALEEGKKSLKFDLLPNRKWHKVIDNNGNEIDSPKRLSATYATGYLKLLRELLAKEFFTQTRSEVLLEPKSKQSTDDLSLMI